MVRPTRRTRTRTETRPGWLRSPRPLAGVAQLRGYQRSWLRGDVLAGVTVAAYLVPQVMAYAEAAALPVVVGLWAILGPLLVYAVVGSSRQLSVGPESTTALMTAAAVGSIAGQDPADHAALAAALALFDLEDHGIGVVGDIPSGLPTPGIPSVSGDDVAAMLLPAVGVAIVAYSDNVLTARAFAARTGYTVDSNQELLALGTANLASGVMQGFPVSSSGSRTVIGDALGSRSQLYSLVALALVLSTLLFLGPVLSSFPSAALGAIIMYAATRLVDIFEFKRLARFRRSEFVLALATTIAVLALDVLYGVVVAIALSILDLLRRVARPHDGILGYAPGVAGMHDLDDYPDAKAVPGLVVYRYDSALFFANVENFKRRALAAVETATQPVQWFVLNAEANVQVDITAIDALDELREELNRRGIVFAMARVKQDLRVDLDAAGFVGRLGDDLIFPTLPTAVEAYADWYQGRHGRRPPGIAPPPSP